MVDADDGPTSRRANEVAQQRLAVLNRARSQIVAVEVDKVEGKIGELVGLA